MKTDRFTDIIRRKLESIRPEFTDKDWTRMQSTLKDANLSQPNTPGVNNPFSGGVWSSGKSWLLAAASVSTVMLVTYGFWQQREINQLRQTIGQLQKHPANQSAPASSKPASAETEQVRPDVAHSGKAMPVPQSQESVTSANRNESQAVRPDTVYITRYVPAPSGAKSGIRPDIRTEEQLSQHVKTLPEQRYATNNPTVPPVITRQPTNPNKNQQTESYDVSSTPSVAKNTNAEPIIAHESTNTSVKSSPGPTKEQSSINQTTRRRNPERNDVSSPNSVDNQRNAAANTNAAADNKTAQTEPSAALNETLANYELATGLPLSIGRKNWSAALAQRAKRMRPARTVVGAEPTQAQSPASQPVQRVATRFRTGVGGEVASRLWSAGVFTEVLLGRHWTLGIGLSQATYQNQFITEEEFNDRTHHDFRKEIARPGDMWRDIRNIDTRQINLQAPITLGYRVPLTQRLTLVPTVGTYLNLTNSETITYYCRDVQRPPFQPQLPRGFDEISTSRSQSVNVINSLALGAGMEWQRGHWVVQGAPVVTIPLQNGQQMKPADLNLEKNMTIGLRARVLYQF